MTENRKPPIGRPKKGTTPGGPGGKMMPGEKARDFKGTMSTLLKRLKPYKWKFIVVFFFSIASTIFTIISPAILGSATDVVVRGISSGTGIDFNALLKIIIFLAALYIVSFLFSSIQSFIMAGLSQNVVYKLRRDMSEKMDRLPLKYFDTKTNGEIQSRMVNDIETINQTLNQSLTQAISSVTTLVGILVMMLTINWLMTLAALIVMPLSMLIIKLVVGKSQAHFKNQQKYLGRVNSHVEEMFTGHTIVKAFNQEDNSETVFEEYNDKLYDSAWRSQFLSGLMMPLTGFVGNLAYVVVCILGGALALRGTVSIGNIQAFIQYVRSFNHPIQTVANIMNLLQSTAAAAERVFEFLDEEEENNSAVCRPAPDPDMIRGEICFEHVQFGYGEEPVIRDFSFTVQPGQRIAIVGPTGAGKTTLVKLLMHYYELDSGRITIDGIDIRDFSRQDLRTIFGMVLQDTWLFNGSVTDNIRYGNMEASDTEVIDAAKAARIHHFIMTHAEGYDMEINEEASNISQGQKQLLTIARAFLADAPLLILDEATSSVDTRTEAQIQQAMADLMHGRTSFIIAHRLSTIRDADCILVMNHGDIVEQGTHEELLAADGFYANLYNSQFANQTAAG
ncbi:MAG: ABC transporter ATP-binding protein [Firmicutes bacterium]|nr:ABC transporter ATP-binding protein [Bacillota bacterium]